MIPESANSIQRPGRRQLRQGIRWLVLVAAVLLAWPQRPEASTSVWLPALSPVIAVGSALSVGAVGLLALVAMPVLGLAVVFPRWFCRHGCPVGLLQELVERVRPRGTRNWLKWPPAGGWLLLLTLGGALLGYPLLLWLDPLAIFNGFWNAWRTPVTLPTLLTGLGLPLLLLLDLAAPGLWCRRLCPLGAAQDVLGRLRFITHRFAGRRCGQVSLTRPSGTLSHPMGEGRGEGSGTLSHRMGEGWGEGPRRRWFLGVAAGAASALTLRALHGHSPPPLRPPGALDESRFTGVCVRCGNCAQVCPSGIIQPDLGSSGVVGFLTPQLRFAADYCREDCHRCNRVCPSGAIARLSLAEKRRRVIGLARLDETLCLAVQGGECRACAQACPYEAIRMDGTLDPFSPRPNVNVARCNGCGACEALCPTQPDRAMRVH